MENIRLFAYERQHGFELVIQVRLAGSAHDEWATIKSLATKTTKDQLKTSGVLNGALDWLDTLKESYPQLEFRNGFVSGKATRGRRY